MGSGFRRQRQWWNNDLSPAQREALRQIATHAPGIEIYVRNLRNVRRSTLQALERYGLVKSSPPSVPSINTTVEITSRDVIARILLTPEEASAALGRSEDVLANVAANIVAGIPWKVPPNEK